MGPADGSLGRVRRVSRSHTPLELILAQQGVQSPLYPWKMAWRDTITVKKDFRMVRNESDYEAIGQDDNTSLLELERKTAFTRAKEQEGELFAGTEFTNAEPANVLKNITFDSPNDEALPEPSEREEEEIDVEQARRRHHKSLYARLDDFVDRVAGSTGSRDGERESSRDSDASMSRRISTAARPVKKMVSKLARSASIRIKNQVLTAEEEMDLETQSAYSSDNPKFKPSAAAFIEGRS